VSRLHVSDDVLSWRIKGHVSIYLLDELRGLLALCIRQGKYVVLIKEDFGVAMGHGQSNTH
jgi:hypothetical protein